MDHHDPLCNNDPCTCELITQARDAEAVRIINALLALAPLCREPSVQFASSPCNCWAGITACIQTIKDLP